MRWKLILVFLMFTLCLSVTAQPQPRKINRSFYFWKTEFLLKEQDIAQLQFLGVNRLYIKFFDVVWENGPVPIAQIRFGTPPPQWLALVPTVYITNDTIKNLPDSRIPELADRIEKKLIRIISVHKIRKVPEIQLDCDWNTGTRSKYFRLLQEIRTKLGVRKIQLSATIRLHQVKFREQTGVPPVDRGMLMFYNLAPLTQFSTKNSIIDLAIGQSYLGRLEQYPLPLDLALPVFSWGVIFQDHRFIGLVNHFQQADVVGNPAFEPYRGKYFRVKSNVYMHEVQLYKGDLIRIEESDAATCRAGAGWIASKIGSTKPASLALFYWDGDNLRRFGHAQLEDIFNSFR